MSSQQEEFEKAGEPSPLKAAAVAYLAALDRLSKLNDLNGGDNGSIGSPCYQEWLEVDCAYTEALEALRAAVR